MVFKRALRVTFGSLLVAVGLAGLALPIMPGWIFLIPGLVLLSREFHWARRTLDWLRERIPEKYRQQPDQPKAPPATGSANEQP